MKKLLFFLQLFIFFIGYSVPTHWNFDSQGVEMTLVFNSKTIGIENNNAVDTDLKKMYQVGAFLNRNGQEICIGYTSYNANGTSNLKIWGLPQDDLDSIISLKLWDTVNNCEIVSIKTIETENNTALKYRPNQTITITSLIFSKNVVISYKKEYCSNGLIAPNMQDNVKGLLFSSSNSLILIDKTNGIIDNINLKTTESTTISISSTETCLQNTSYTITIYPSPQNSSSTIISCPENTTLNSSEINEEFTYKWLHNSSNLATTNVINEGIYVLEKNYHSCIGYDTFSVVHQNINSEAIEFKNETCLNKGILTIDSKNSIENNSNPLLFQLNEEISYTGIFNSLSEGLYLLQVKTSKNCLFTYSFKIENECKSTNENILVPHLEEYATFPINSTGKIQIFNRDGQLIKTLVGPTNWNGTNEKGEVVPIGIYFIIQSNGQRISVTLLD